jgi:hypothetical protein
LLSAFSDGEDCRNSEREVGMAAVITVRGDIYMSAHFGKRMRRHIPLNYFAGIGRVRKNTDPVSNKRPQHVARAGDMTFRCQAPDKSS